MHNVLVNNWNKILQYGLRRNVIEGLLEKSPLSKDFETVQTQSINLEVKHMLRNSGLKKEKFQIVAQEQLGLSIFFL